MVSWNPYIEPVLGLFKWKKSRNIQEHSGITKLHSIVAECPDSVFWPVWASYSLFHDTLSTHWLHFLAGKGTGVQPHRLNLTKHLLLQTPSTPTLGLTYLSSGIKSQMRNSVFFVLFLFVCLFILNKTTFSKESSGYTVVDQLAQEFCSVLGPGFSAQV